MRMRKITISKYTFLIAYKLLHDAMLLALITFAGVLTADALLPGFVTSKISFSKIALTLIVIASMIVYLGKQLGIAYKESQKLKGKILPALIIFSFLLIGNSLLKFTLWENIVITVATLFVFFLLYELIFSSEE